MLAFWTPNRTVSVALYDLLRRLKSELNALNRRVGHSLDTKGSLGIPSNVGYSMGIALN